MALTPRHSTKSEFSGFNIGDRPKSNIAKRHRTGTEQLSTESKLLFLADNNRQFLLLQNRTPQPVWVNFNNIASETDGFEISAGGFLQRDIDTVPKGDIHMLGSFADQNINFELG